MSRDTHELSVIICTYTEARWDDLVDAVSSALRQRQPPREVVVVVDHNPALFTRVRRDLRDVVAIENVEERGLSGGRNSGVRVARGDVVAFLDDDAVAAPDWSEMLLQHYSDARVYGVGGAIEPMWPGARPGWFPAEFDWVVGCTYRGLPDSTSAVRNLIGCNMSFRRAVFEEIDGFRNGIGRVGTRPIGCEETELCIRVRKRWPACVLLYEPGARVGHKVPEARTRWSYFRSRCYSEGLSKALVSRLVGASDGLASERAYTLRTLPAGVARGLGATLSDRSLHGISRAGAIVAGLSVTTAGYVVGTVSQRLAPTGALRARALS